ncbi:hypothetical protein [Stakelama tenebrarum]|uniref:DUF4760 domain-containing protein n=1 Tax=Stakelama tenebrarum TaxID=2711215 RepID=A0A6G6Y0K2_9SPHN|nr:hypothetical protein [Sphingosinithalassobacter tenebrarum]QIG78440.1 hypothetical protein G5C33_00610 [Sphingosinithalassobacter tenebrarum]
MDWASQITENLLAAVALGLSLVSLIVSLTTYFFTEAREQRVEKSAAYLDLEVQSGVAFQYAATNAELMDPLRKPERPASLPKGAEFRRACETTLNLYFQSLNLFEVCARFRRQLIIAPEVFASWVAWFYEIQDDWYFREMWPAEIRTNYTDDVRAIFDVGCAIFASPLDQERREEAFYAAVAEIMDCRVIRGWLDRLDTPVRWETLKSHTQFA